MKIKTSPYEVAERFIGMKEVSGHLKNNPQIMAMLKLVADWPQNDEVPWCSALVFYIAFFLGLKTPEKRIGLLARSWLTVGIPVVLEHADIGVDVVVVSRGSGDQPGPEVIMAPGHVGFFGGLDGDNVMVLGGNQNDSVSIKPFIKTRVLGIRRLL